MSCAFECGSYLLLDLLQPDVKHFGHRQLGGGRHVEDSTSILANLV